MPNTAAKFEELRTNLETLAATRAAAEVATTQVTQSLVSLSQEGLGVQETAAVIDAVHLTRGAVPASDADFTRRLITNLTTLINPGEPYAIVRSKLPWSVHYAAIPADPFLEPRIQMVTDGQLSGTRRLPHADILYTDSKDGPDSRGFFSDIATTSQDHRFHGPIDLLRKFFGAQDFSTVSDQPFTATAVEGKLSLITDAVELRRLVRMGFGALGAEEADGNIVTTFDNTIDALGRIGINMGDVRADLSKLSRKSRTRVIDRVVAFLAEGEEDFRMGRGSCRVDHQYLGGKKLVVTGQYPNLSGLQEDIPERVFKQVGPFKWPRRDDSLSSYFSPTPAVRPISIRRRRRPLSTR